MFVYFIQSADRVKIGKTADLGRRLYEGETFSPYPLVLLGALLSNKKNELTESLIQQKFKKLGLWSHREWFIADPVIFDFIKENCMVNIQLIKASYENTSQRAELNRIEKERIKREETEEAEKEAREKEQRIEEEEQRRIKIALIELKERAEGGEFVLCHPTSDEPFTKKTLIQFITESRDNTKLLLVKNGKIDRVAAIAFENLLNGKGEPTNVRVRVST